MRDCTSSSWLCGHRCAAGQWFSGLMAISEELVAEVRRKRLDIMLMCLFVSDGIASPEMLVSWRVSTSLASRKLVDYRATSSYCGSS